MCLFCYRFNVKAPRVVPKKLIKKLCRCFFCKRNQLLVIAKSHKYSSCFPISAHRRPNCDVPRPRWTRFFVKTNPTDFGLSSPTIKLFGLQRRSPSCRFRITHCPIRLISLRSLPFRCVARKPNAVFSNLWRSQSGNGTSRLAYISIGHPSILPAQRKFNNCRRN